MSAYICIYIYIYIHISLLLTFLAQVRALPSPQNMFKSDTSSEDFDRLLIMLFIEVNSGVNNLNHFLVLLCGVGFIFISGLAFLVLRVVEKYPLSNKTQRILHLAVFIFLAIFCILIFDWYSSEYIKNSSKS